jgi:hypothetical protein
MGRLYITVASYESVISDVIGDVRQKELTT